MEMIYENTCVDTQEEYYQMFAWLMPRWSRVTGAVFCVFGVLAVLMALIVDISYLLSGIFLLAGGAYLMLSYRINGKTFFKKKVDTYGENLPPKTYQFYDDHFRVFDIDSNATVEYRRIRRIGVLKDCISLMLDPSGAVYTLTRNSFTKGTDAELIRFLRQKCPNAKISE